MIPAIGTELEQERKHAEQAGRYQHSAVAALNICGVHDRVNEKPQDVYKEMTFLPLDLLARLEAVRIDTRAPFSALLTL